MHHLPKCMIYDEATSKLVITANACCLSFWQQFLTIYYAHQFLTIYYAHLSVYIADNFAISILSLLLLVLLPLLLLVLVLLFWLLLLALFIFYHCVNVIIIVSILPIFIRKVEPCTACTLNDLSRSIGTESYMTFKEKFVQINIVN